MTPKTNLFQFFLPLFLFFIFISPNISIAGGPVHGAKGAAMGTAFVAVSDDGSAIIYNPAGLTQQRGMRGYAGGSIVNIDSTYERPDGARESTDYQFFYNGHLYLSSDFGTENAVFGLAIYSPLGIGGREWDAQGLTRFFSTKNIIETRAINSSLAYRVNSALSVGMGINYVIGEARSALMIDQSPVGGTDAAFESDGRGDAWGVSAGILYAVNKKVRLAFAYRSAMKVDQTGTARLKNIAPAVQPLFGGSTFQTPFRSELRFPRFLSLGLAYTPTKSVLLSFELEDVRWSTFKTMTLDFENEVPAAGFSDRKTVMDFQDILAAKMGIEVKATEALSLRSGYAYVPTPVPGHTLEPGNPDADSHQLSLGFGYTFGKFEVDTYLTVSLFKKRKINNGLLNGNYENDTFFTGFSLGYRF